MRRILLVMLALGLLAPLAPSATAMFDDLAWWARATMQARHEDQAKAA